MDYWCNAATSSAQQDLINVSGVLLRLKGLSTGVQLAARSGPIFINSGIKWMRVNKCDGGWLQARGLSDNLAGYVLSYRTTMCWFRRESQWVEKYIEWFWKCGLLVFPAGIWVLRSMWVQCLAQVITPLSWCITAESCHQPSAQAACEHPAQLSLAVLLHSTHGCILTCVWALGRLIHMQGKPEFGSLLVKLLLK